MVKETLASAIAPKVCSSKPGWQFDPGTTQKPSSMVVEKSAQQSTNRGWEGCWEWRKRSGDECMVFLLGWVAEKGMVVSSEGVSDLHACQPIFQYDMDFRAVVFHCHNSICPCQDNPMIRTGDS